MKTVKGLKTSTTLILFFAIVLGWTAVGRVHDYLVITSGCSDESKSSFLERTAAIKDGWTERQVTDHLGKPDETTKMGAERVLVYKWKQVESVSWHLGSIKGSDLQRSFQIKDGIVNHLSGSNGSWSHN